MIVAGQCMANDFVEFVDAREIKHVKEAPLLLECGNVSTIDSFLNSIENCPLEIKNINDTVNDFTSIAIEFENLRLTCAIARYHLGHFNKHYNYLEALRLFDISTRHGNLNAFFYLGEMYQNGTGVRRNEEVAFAFYSISLLRGKRFSQETRLRLAVLNKLINPDATDDIKRLITEKYELAMMADSMRFVPTFMLGIHGNYHAQFCQ
tara:strand:+ start:27054 stop:27674 length:621 start_codon:yes stop_codon:yes gene_type:complete